jgi:hypothetical protein
MARLGSNQRPLVCKTSALPSELPAREAPGQGLEPRPPRSERGILPLDDPGTVKSAPAPTLRPPFTRRSAQRRCCWRSYVTSAVAERCCLSHSPALRPWTAATRLYKRRVVVLRGGALEPESRSYLGEMGKLKPTLHFLRQSTRPTKRLSLSSGASIRSRSFSS